METNQAETIRYANDGGVLLKPCKIWTGCIRKTDGYGLHSSGRMAHRVVYEREVGLIPVGMEIDHRCRVRACVEPEHLKPVTHQRNVAESDHRNRRKTLCPQGHPLDGGSSEGARPRRWCKTCKRERSRARYPWQETCRKGHPYDGVNARGYRTCSRCMSASGTYGMGVRWHGVTSPHD